MPGRSVAGRDPAPASGVRGGGSGGMALGMVLMVMSLYHGIIKPFLMPDMGMCQNVTNYIPSKKS